MALIFTFPVNPKEDARQAHVLARHKYRMALELQASDPLSVFRYRDAADELEEAVRRLREMETR